MTKQEVLRCFWLPKGYYNDCVSGANMYTIKKYGENPVEENDDDVAAEIISLAAKFPQTERYLQKNKSVGEEFAQFINATLDEIYSGGSGVVFTKVQAVTVCSFLHDPEIAVYDGYYYINLK